MSADPADQGNQGRVEARRGHPLPEERTVGSDDTWAQADVIGAESDIREVERRTAPDTILERRTPDQAVIPVEPPD